MAGAASDRIGYLRAIAIGTLVQDAVRLFMEEEEAILNGELDVALLDKSRYKAQIEDIIDLSVERIYQAPEVVEKEVAGYKILSDILEVSTEALVAIDVNSGKGTQKKNIEETALMTNLEAAAEIAAAIDLLNARGGLDAVFAFGQNQRTAEIAGAVPDGVTGGDGRRVHARTGAG